MSPLRSVARFAAQTFAIVAVELRKLVRDPTELFTRAVQPTLWLLVFGTVMSKMRGIGTGSVPYLDFMAPGILAQSVLFSAIFYGIAVIWERDLGLVHKLLASPAYRPALVLGKALSAGLRGLVQATIILIIALAMAVDVRLDPLSLLGVVLTVILGSALFATFSLVIACLVKTRERFMGVGQLMTMPLFFASNAIYPLELMPGWLRVIAGVNPLTYLVDALRTLMVHGTTSAHGLVADFAVLVSGFLVVLWIASRLYPGLAR
ncbi:MAG: ABC transporter permease [Myxococcota bacterium]